MRLSRADQLTLSQGSWLMVRNKPHTNEKNDSQKTWVDFWTHRRVDPIKER
jgi:hypothetical protein